MRNKIFCLIFILCTFVVSIGSAAALSSTTSAALNSNNTTANNLISYAVNYDDFLSSDYVVYQEGTYSYYIVWGNLKYNNSVITNDGIVNYVHYYREGTPGDYNYTYVYNTDDNFSLNINHSIITNITGAGGNSITFIEHYFYKNAMFLFIFSVAVLLCLLFLRRDK